MVLGHIDSKAGVHYPIIPQPTDRLYFSSEINHLTFNVPSRCNNTDPQMFTCFSIQTKSLQKEGMCLYIYIYIKQNDVIIIFSLPVRFYFSKEMLIFVSRGAASVAKIGTFQREVSRKACRCWRWSQTEWITYTSHSTCYGKSWLYRWMTNWSV